MNPHDQKNQIPRVRFLLGRVFGLIAFGLAFAGSGNAAVTVTGRFDLASSGQQFIGSKTLADSTVMQSFAFDNTNGYIYTLQVSETDATKTKAEHERDGDLTVTKLSLTGSIVGTMYLRGFGHGVGLGVEPVGTTAWLWTEVDSVPDGGSPNTGHGKKVARFKFVNGTTRSNTDAVGANFSRFAPAANAHPTDPQISCSVDMVNGRLAIRYLDNTNNRRFSLYSLAAVKASIVSPYPAPPTLATLSLASMPLQGQTPASSRLGWNENDTRPPATTAYTFQGFATHGSYLYLLYGNSYDTVASPGNTELYSFSWNTSLPTSWVQEATTAVFGSLTFREPEGMSIRKSGSAYQLCFGFASDAAGSRKANIAYKAGWIP